MILVCPACDAKFKIPDGAIPPEGRKVRCAKCQHAWHAIPDQILTAPAAAQPVQRPAAPRPAPPPPPPQMPDDVDAGEAARAAAIRRTVREEPVAAPPPPAFDDDDMFEEGIPAPAPRHDSDFDEDEDVGGDDFGVGAAFKNPFKEDADADAAEDEDEQDEVGGNYDGDEEEYEDGDFVARRRAEMRRQAERDSVARRRKLMLFGWVGLILFWAVVFYGLVFMRETVVHSFPGMQGFYGMFAGSNEIEQLKKAAGDKELSTPFTEREVYVTAKLYGDRTGVETVAGRPTLVVRGFVENTGTVAGAMTASVPQVRVDVLDAQGRVLDTVVTDPPGFALRRGAKLDFETNFYPVPPGAANVSVKVLEGTRSKMVPSAAG